MSNFRLIYVSRPSNPLRVLGEFLIQKSNEVEGGASSSNKSLN